MTSNSIKTSRTYMRLLKQDDIDLLHPLESDDKVKLYFPGGARERAKTKDMIDRFMIAYTKNKLPCFIIFERASGEFIGRAGFGMTGSGEIEVGYVLHTKFWGRGYATEAVTALLEYAKENIAAEFIIAYADIENIGSLRVMEKCGMIYYKTEMEQDIQCKFYKIKNSK
jgi:[ribosomal protein S5]-alanine N-acetyltransferase